MVHGAKMERRFTEIVFLFTMVSPFLSSTAFFEGESLQLLYTTYMKMIKHSFILKEHVLLRLLIIWGCYLMVTYRCPFSSNTWVCVFPSGRSGICICCWYRFKVVSITGSQSFLKFLRKHLCSNASYIIIIMWHSVKNSHIVVRLFDIILAK